jgi:nucleoside-diphosphate-sugar epimerase
MEITGKTALVTGANRGLGRHLAQELRDRGATVYAAARNPESVDLAGVTPIALDVTDPASVAAAAARTRLPAAGPGHRATTRPPSAPTPRPPRTMRTENNVRHTSCAT